MKSISLPIYLVGVQLLEMRHGGAVASSGRQSVTILSLDEEQAHTPQQQATAEQAAARARLEALVRDDAKRF